VQPTIASSHQLESGAEGLEEYGNCPPLSKFGMARGITHVHRLLEPPPISCTLLRHSIWEAGRSGSLRSDSDSMSRAVSTRQDDRVDWRAEKSSAISLLHASASALLRSGSVQAM
jgi:hypothetical protein